MANQADSGAGSGDSSGSTSTTEKVPATERVPAARAEKLAAERDKVRAGEAKRGPGRPKGAKSGPKATPPPAAPAPQAPSAEDIAEARKERVEARAAKIGLFLESVVNKPLQRTEKLLIGNGFEDAAGQIALTEPEITTGAHTMSECVEELPGWLSSPWILLAGWVAGVTLPRHFYMKEIQARAAAFQAQNMGRGSKPSPAPAPGTPTNGAAPSEIVTASNGFKAL